MVKEKQRALENAQHSLQSKQKEDSISQQIDMEKQIFYDPWMSEWGNPAGRTPATYK